MLALQRLPQLQELEMSDVCGPTAGQLDDTLRRCAALQFCLMCDALLLGCSLQASTAALVQGCLQPHQCTSSTNPVPHAYPSSCSLTALHRLAVESHSPACKTPALRSLAFLPRIRRLAVAQAHQLQSFVGLTNLGSLKGEAAGGCGGRGHIFT